MKAQDELRDAYVNYRNRLPDIFVWEDEKQRLNKLYFCLLLRISGKDEVEVSRIIAALDYLNLLDTENLAKAELVGGKGRKGNKIASLISDILIHNGIESKTANECVVAICEVAKGINISYQGKLQKFLRKYANLMLEELNDTFSFSRIAEEDERYIFTHWLQDVLEMPIPLSNEFVEKFCEEKDIKVGDLIEAADSLDINVAVVDDLIKMYMLDKAESAYTEVGT